MNEATGPSKYTVEFEGRRISWAGFDTWEAADKYAQGLALGRRRYTIACDGKAADRPVPPPAAELSPPAKNSKPSIYLIGSLRNPKVLEVAAALRAAGHEVFDDWYSAGERADDSLQAYAEQRGWSYAEMLASYAAQHVFNFDKGHIDRCSIGLLVLPAGKSGHLELGYMLGRGKKGYILLDGTPGRIDVMYAFADKVFASVDEAVGEIG